MVIKFIKYLFAVLLIVFCFHIAAQNVINTDSINSVILDRENNDLSDAEKLKLLNSFSDRYALLKPGKLIHYGKMALILSEKLNLKNDELIAINNIGDGFLNLNDLEEAIKYYLKALKINEELGNTAGIIKSYFNLSEVYSLLNNNELAEEYLKKSLELSKNYSQIDNLQMAYNNLGNFYCQLFKNEDALKNFQKSLELSIENNDTVGMAASYNNMGNVYKNIENNEEALKYYLKANKIFIEMNDPFYIAGSFGNIAIIYSAMQDEENALKYFSKAFELRKTYKLNRGIPKLICNIAQLYYVQNDFEKSLQYLDTALMYAKMTKSDEDIFRIYYYYSELYLINEDYQRSLNYYKFFTAKKDSLFTIESSKKIADMQVKYDTQKKEKENELLRKESQIQKYYRNFLILISLLILIIAIITFNRYLLKKRTNKLLSEKKKQLEILNATKDKFFSIIAHDLKNPFGTLLSVSQLLANNYYELSEEHKIKIIQTINNSAKLTYNLLENLLHWSVSQQGSMTFDPTKICINDVIADANSLLQLNLEKKNIKLNANFKKDFYGFADRNMLATVFRNLLSNAIKFSHENGEITISIEEMGENNIISFRDTGIGISEKDLQKLFKIEVNNASIGKSKEKGTGLGLILCKEFISKNNGKIWVESKSEIGSTFFVSIPKV